MRRLVKSLCEALASGMKRLMSSPLPEEALGHIINITLAGNIRRRAVFPVEESQLVKRELSHDVGGTNHILK